jgi:DNA polymerase-3 subunit gamma/tau
MLRTHGELGYRQEQRFHLELGLLKLAHAQRLLPIEQLLSGAEVTRPGPDRKPAAAPEPKRPELSPSRSFVSPFAADTARKGTPRSELSSEEVAVMPSRQNPAAMGSPSVIMGAAAPAVAPQTAAVPKSDPPDSDQLRNAVLKVLASAGQTMLGSMLENGEWKVAGNELTVRVAASPSLIDMSVSSDAKRMMIATASGVLGRPAKVQIVPGSNAQLNQAKPPASNGSGRGRAEQEPVVQRMKEKFGAEIRTIIDYRRNK